MLNQYPIWKYLLLLVVLGVSIVYALPNVYGEDPALQVSSSRNATVNLATQEKVRELLQQANVAVKNIALANDQLLMRFPDTDSQLKAKDIVKEGLAESLSAVWGDNVTAYYAPDAPRFRHCVWKQRSRHSGSGRDRGR